jgi:hypothetical protein
VNTGHYDELVEAVRALLMREPGAGPAARRLLLRLPNRAKALIPLTAAEEGVE